MASAGSNKSTKDDLNNADDQSIRMSGFDELAKMDEDAAVLRANGHAAAMPRQFNWLSALGLGFSITNSWIGYFSCFGQNLIYGGAQATIFSLIVAFFCQGIVTLGVGELASAYPSSGGQYHFCYILSPPRTKKYSAYVVGWISLLAWWTVTCSGISLAAIVLNGLINFCIPSYEANQWQTYVVYVAVSFTTVIPVFIADKVSFIAQLSLFLSLGGYLIFFITSLVMHQHTQPGSYLTESGLGNSGWNPGAAWLLAISNAMYAYGGTDGVIHICEEMPRPGKKVPQVMMATMVIGLVTSLSLFIVLMVFMVDLDAVRTSTLPSLELMYQVTGSRKATIALFVLIFVVYFISLPNQWVTCGRIAWAFARDNGTPYPEFFSHIHTKLQFPVNATIAAFIFTCIYGLLYLASTTAFNSIITSAVLFLNISYVVPQGILLFGGRSVLPKRYLNFGWFGYFCNVFSLFWIVMLGVLICMPPGLPVHLQSMNYTPVIVVGVFVIINLLWLFSRRKSFEGPHIDWEALKAGV